MMDSSTWNVSDHPMHTTGDDDFQQFLDMNGMGNLNDSLNYDFQDFQATGNAHILSSSREQLDTPMSGTDAPIVLSQDSVLQHQLPTMTSAGPYQTIPTTMMPPPTPSEAIVNSLDAQIQFLQQQKMQHQRRQLEEQQAAFFAHQQNRIVPPTPQSLEIPPGTNQYYSQPGSSDRQQHTPLDYRYQRTKDQQDMAFTPLVSPAVTPLETQFSIDTQFTVPGAYFSPLTSPALHAQNDSLSVYDHRHSNITVSSPVDIDLDAGNAPLPNPALGEPAKKARKAAAKPRSKASVKQSPISKPMRRKTAATPILNAQVLTELVENAEKDQDARQQSSNQAQTSNSSTAGATDSENGSVSPQALNDIPPIEMPPPPIPKSRSAKPSPFIGPQIAGPSNPTQPRPGAPSPATPASLMKLSSPNNRTSAARTGSQEPVDAEHIESFELPESANFLRSDTSSTTPHVAAQSTQDVTTPSLAPPPSPIFAKPAMTPSANQSPQLLPGSGSGSGTRKTPLLMPRGSKKRGSVSSIQVSPALRPKISPNIKPLLPGSVTAEETASHLLATKSNYQRILEGSTVPGVSYPSELSTNLTSKRTSHKIAEQGRRNRINSALQEIATLLPNPPKESKPEPEPDKKDKDKGGNGAAPNSKASTVEMAIEYIKQLQKEVAEANRRAEEAEKKLQAIGAEGEKT
ncbi:helix-loop-helix DNA-binding domain-containing protein [Cercophora newfieldiana]|uniref:Helix-loop-helix DNA-binding domain-containing protein n=1 Tax=Cercophora newfieldiana TaxID=92897 RepID=A0AA39YPM1_9PEZI|nr:helix-loop-helix DNA-binding domain-containing protein [Cercophora newfieldiana]